MNNFASNENTKENKSIFNKPVANHPVLSVLAVQQQGKSVFHPPREMNEKDNCGVM